MLLRFRTHGVCGHGLLLGTSINCVKLISREQPAAKEAKSGEISLACVTYTAWY